MKSIEEADSPEEFIAALRRQADTCREDAMELRTAHQDKTAGHFWIMAANKLDRMAAALEEIP